MTSIRFGVGPAGLALGEHFGHVFPERILMDGLILIRFLVLELGLQIPVHSNTLREVFVFVMPSRSEQRACSTFGHITVPSSRISSSALPGFLAQNGHDAALEILTAPDEYRALTPPRRSLRGRP